MDWDNDRCFLQSVLDSLNKEGGFLYNEKLLYKYPTTKVFKKKWIFSHAILKPIYLQNSTPDLPTSTQLHKVINPYKNDYPLRILLNKP